MTVKDIYSKIFNVSDDNNYYANLSSNDLTNIQLIEPSISVKKFELKGNAHANSEYYPERVSFRIPLVSINDFVIEQIHITNFYVDYSSFMPTIMVEFIDTDNKFLSDSFVKDGTIIKLYIGGQGDELYYKPIRQDFVLTNVQKIGKVNQNYGDPMIYRVFGTLNVPVINRKESWSSGKINARQALFDIAVYSGLGFATNFPNVNNIDKMKWSNTQNRTIMDFAKDITNHACYSPSTFFTSFIDQYYVLNFIEVHSLLSHGGLKTDIPAMMYSCLQQIGHPKSDDSAKGQTRNEINVDKGYTDLMNTEQKLSYYFISNNEDFNGWSNYIEEYYEISNSASSINDGYKVKLDYSDSNGGGWGQSNCEFIIYPIDNLARDGERYIENLPDNPTQESYIPLNLPQTTSSEYLTSDDTNDINNITSHYTTISMGKVDTSNTFKHFYFAKVQNDYQMNCLKKCGLCVTLQNYNPSITKFSRIWVDIYDKNPRSNNLISKIDKEPNNTKDYNKIIDMHNNDILQFEDEGTRKNYPRGVYNRSLSGWYVVTEMKIVYSPKEHNLHTVLTLNRIEYKPTFVSEYNIARDAINNKYRNDNTPEKIFG